MANLHELGLYSNGLTGTIPSSLASMTNLNWLGLRGNKLNGTMPPLPFAQYTGACLLDHLDGCTEPKTATVSSARCLREVSSTSTMAFLLAFIASKHCLC
jgi:hypothetical protein